MTDAEKQQKKDTLQAILNASNLEYIDLDTFDLTQPDSMDESGSDGLWDLAGMIANQMGIDITSRRWDSIQTLLYNLLATYRCCDEEDEI